MPTRDIQDLTAAELESWCVEGGEPPYRARQILAWVHRQAVPGFDDMENLPKALRARLAAAFTISRLDPAVVVRAAFLVLTFFHLAGPALYGILWVLVPYAPGEESLLERWLGTVQAALRRLRGAATEPRVPGPRAEGPSA